MAVETYQFLNQAGVEKLASELLGKVNLRIAERIVTEVNEASSENVVASAKTVYDLLAAVNSAAETLKGRVDGHDTAIGDINTAQGVQDGKIGALETSQGVQDGKIGALETDLAALQQTVEGLTHLTIETVTGAISTVTDPKTDVLYMQRDDESDKTWMLYTYHPATTEGGEATWINVGDTEVDLSNYWTKDSIDEMREALSMHDAEAIPDANIASSVEAAFAATAVTL